MKKIYLLSTAFILVCFTLAGFAQKTKVVGKQFPELTGTTLEDKSITIPNDTKNKYTLIGMAYSRDAERELQTWLNPAYNKFIAKNNLIDYDVNIYFIPMFTGISQAVAGVAKKNMMEATDTRFYSYLILFRGSIKKYKAALEFESKETPYFFVIDKDGKIIYATSGVYSDEKMEEILSNIEES